MPFIQSPPPTPEVISKPQQDNTPQKLNLMQHYTEQIHHEGSSCFPFKSIPTYFSLSPLPWPSTTVDLLFISVCCVCSVAQSCSILQPCGLQPTRILCLWNFPGKNSGTGCHCLLQRIFPTHGSNPCLFHLLHWQPDSLRLCHLRSPFSISTALLFEEYYTSELFHSAYFSGDSYKLLLVSIIYSLLLSSIAQYDFIRCLPIHSLMNT